MAPDKLYRRADLLRRLLPQSLWRPLRAFATALLTPLRFSRTTGHWRSSIARSACSADGTPIPWYTYPAIDFLAQRDFRERHVLEFGGGNSTIWWSARAKSVLTVEQDEDRLAGLQAKVGANVRLHHLPGDPLTRSINPVKDLIERQSIRTFDVIVIDGHLRQELVEVAFEHLAPGGAIVFDNAEGYGFFDETSWRDCRRIDFYGFAPAVSRRHCTSIVIVGDCFLLAPDVPVRVLDA